MSKKYNSVAMVFLKTLIFTTVLLGGTVFILSFLLEKAEEKYAENIVTEIRKTEKNPDNSLNMTTLMILGENGEKSGTTFIIARFLSAEERIYLIPIPSDMVCQSGTEKLTIFEFFRRYGCKKALKAISEERMDEALVVVMMNSINYAGTCYMYSPEGTGNYGNGVSVSYFPVGIDDTALAQVLHHEAGGHGFAKLADEYAYAEYGAVPADYVAEIQAQQNSWGWWKNVDFTDDLSTIRWNYFISDNRYAYDGLGAYEGGLTYWRGVWRPTENSIMRYNTGGFNAPSREAIYYRIHKLAYGDSWEYDYEDFVEYDAKNRQSSSTRASNYVVIPHSYKPLHAPITIKGSWKNAKNHFPKKKVSSNRNLYKAPVRANKPKTMPTKIKASYYRTPDGKLQHEIKTEHMKE